MGWFAASHFLFLSFGVATLTAQSLPLPFRRLSELEHGGEQWEKAESKQRITSKANRKDVASERSAGFWQSQRSSRLHCSLL